jgi:hypothetical protein
MAASEEEEGGAVAVENRIGQSVCVSAELTAALMVTRCSGCFVYCMKPVAEVVIRGCKATTVFVARSQSVALAECTECAVTCAADQIRIVDCAAVRLFSYTPVGPELIRSQGVVLAPYNAAVASPPPSGANAWSQPRASDSAFSLLDPAEFAPLVVPFGEIPAGIAAPLPASYRRALGLREQTAERRRQLLMEFFRKAPAHAEMMQAQVAAQFREFLARSDAGRQIQALDQLAFV